MRLLIEGWINHAHSYSIVNIFQMISLSKISNIELYFKEVPAYGNHWSSDDLKNIVTREEMEIIQKVPAWTGDEGDLDYIYRISYPFDVSDAKCPVILFYTSEFLLFKDSDFIHGDLQSFLSRSRDKKLLPVTPSKWSSQALVREKFLPLVIPHGTDTSKYFPCKSTGVVGSREFLGIGPDSFVFLSIGSMTGNKGIKMLIKCFYDLRLILPDAYLVLKGLEGLYSSEKLLNGYLTELIADGHIELSEIQDYLIYIPDTYTFQEMNSLFNSADCYVSPYLAEGFNIPVLDALACGIPVIVSKGGSTDDFTTEEFALYPVTVRASTEVGQQILLVDSISLQEKMIQIYNDVPFRKNVKKSAPLFVKKNYSWDLVTGKILGLIELVEGGPIVGDTPRLF